MTEILTSAQMRAIEAVAMSSGRVTGLDLMERAGRGVVQAVLEHWPELAQSSHSAVVLCGSGNNGGDGYVIARLLRQRGWSVTLCALAAPGTPDAQAMARLWQGETLASAALDWPQFQQADIVVDAMFGTGLQRDIAPGVWGLLDMAKTAGCKLVAVDILSGICADSGRVRAEAGFLEAPADLTVTFQAAKHGHHLDAGAEMSGRLFVVDLGLRPEIEALLCHSGDAVVELTALNPVDLAKASGHKFSHGHALVLAGGAGQGGAARLAARAALRIGAGLVTLAVPEAAFAENAARLEAIMLRRLSKGEAGATDLLRLLEDRRINALCLGPGMGRGAEEIALLTAALRQRVDSPRSEPSAPAAAAHRLVLDADALTILSHRPDLFAALHGDCVLTPHGGEFARLFPDLAERLTAPTAAKAPAFSKIDATREAARRAGCVVLFKGPDTVIADPQGRSAVNSARHDLATPWLATAGAGDVLAGIITGLMARGFRPFEAACTGAALHVAAARSFGPGLIAEDLPEELPKVLRALGL